MPMPMVNFNEPFYFIYKHQNIQCYIIFFKFSWEKGRGGGGGGVIINPYVWFNMVKLFFCPDVMSLAPPPPPPPI